MRSYLPKNFRALSLGIGLLCPFPMIADAAPAAMGADASIQSATGYLDRNDYEGALAALAPAMRDSPHDPQVLNLQGAILTKQKKFELAQNCFSEALKQSPEFFAARYNLGALLALEHKWNEAIDYYRNLLLDQPNNELVEYKLLLLLLHQDVDPELQKKLFATDLPTNTPAWYYATAARAFKNGDPEEAAKYLVVAKNIYGDQTAIYQEELEESGLQKLKK